MTLHSLGDSRENANTLFRGTVSQVTLGGGVTGTAPTLAAFITLRPALLP